MVGSRTERRVQGNPPQPLEACPPLAGPCTGLPDAGTVPLGRDNCISLATFWETVQPTPLSAIERVNFRPLGVSTGERSRLDRGPLCIGRHIHQGSNQAEQCSMFWSIAAAQELTQLSV